MIINEEYINQIVDEETSKILDESIIDNIILEEVNKRLDEKYRIGHKLTNSEKKKFQGAKKASKADTQLARRILDNPAVNIAYVARQIGIKGKSSKSKQSRLRKELKGLGSDGKRDKSMNRMSQFIAKRVISLAPQILGK